MGEDSDVRIWGAEFALKIGGFNTQGEYYVVDREEMSGDGTVDSNTGYFQVGYLFKNNLEIAVRYAEVAPDDETFLDEQNSIGAALNYYFDKHNYKAQADYRRITDDTLDEYEDVVRIQMQFAF